MTNKNIVIVGAGPAGLTAAFELLKSGGFHPIVLDYDTQVGGISKTVNYRGNRMDLGGHRFFSKSDWVMQWWQDILPIDPTHPQEGSSVLTYQQQVRNFEVNAKSRPVGDRVMLVRPRLSRIFYGRKFYDYPVKLNLNTLGNLGLLRAGTIGLSYMKACAFPRNPERSLEDFFINRFGDQLYRTFFKEYTEKVWGVSCQEIDAAWGAQRVKGLSITKALWHAVSSAVRSSDVAQKDVETSLIEQFLYPKLGPGQMWETVAERIVTSGGEIHLRYKVVGIQRDGQLVRSVEVRDLETGEQRRIACDALISTMPLAELTT
jgi:protoporphyrinogen oxidase